ncbi:hypothetical protein VCRA2119O149_5420004 [Vibrio crassostreae]|nr:hypothetical protein VCRA2119O149_5420004 [Vibrio crassostreae]
MGVGLVWFGEMPDIAMAIGTAMIILPLIWLARNEKKQS